jgi:enediyne biosynthesis protein E4
LMLTRGFASSSDTRLHFGLDSTAIIDSILIVWPSQKMQTIKNVAANKALTVSAKDAAGMFNYNEKFGKKLAFTDITSEIACSWKHTENDFLDYNLQYLIPHLESTRGPKLAVADVNGDGLDDFYVCGAKFQPGAMMIQQAKGAFAAIDTAVFATNAISEDADAKFFDANGDGFIDLWVTSGGNEVRRMCWRWKTGCT